MNTSLASHGHGIAVDDLLQRLEIAPPLSGAQEAVEIARQLMQFELGQFLIENRGLNGAWASYIILHPERGRISGLNNQGKPFPKLESWLLNECPVVLATQERFRIFQELTRQHLRPSMKLASIPCGLMDDLLSLDYSEMSGVELTGIDLDDTALQGAIANYDTRKPPVLASFEQQDAWALNTPERWDFITSNGLNMYIEDHSEVVRLYRSFCHSLKPGGHLLISFLTPPPSQSAPRQWRIHDEADLKLQTLIFSEIIQAKWRCFRTEEETVDQLKEAGLEVETVHYDKQRLFPSVLAVKKPS